MQRGSTSRRPLTDAAPFSKRQPALAGQQSARQNTRDGDRRADDFAFAKKSGKILATGIEPAIFFTCGGLQVMSGHRKLFARRKFEMTQLCLTIF